MSKHNNKNNKKKIETAPQVEQTKDEKVPNKKIPYIIGTILFLVLITVSYVVLYTYDTKYASLIVAALFILYFVSTFLSSKKVQNNNKQSIIIPCKILCVVMGCAYFFNFASTGLQYFNDINIQSQNMFDIKHYSNKVFSYEKTDIYVDVANQKAFIVDNNKETEKISVFDLLHENHFDISVVENTLTFYELADNLKFSYIANNDNNEIVIQYTENDTRYLASIDATNFVPLLEEKDNYDVALFKSDGIRFYMAYNPDLILSFTDNKVQVSEYDTITDIEDSSYIDRVHTFIVNHFEEDFVISENASAELLAESLNNDYKVNLYSMQCYSCGYNYGKSDVAEIINEDKSYIFRLSVDSEVLKEGVIYNAEHKE